MSSELTTDREGFWRRQVSLSRTPAQVVFDVTFGVLMPIICFYLDPGIIGISISEMSWMPPVSHDSFLRLNVLVYTLSGLAILTLSVWLTIGHRAKSSGGIFGGILLAGAVTSFVIGVVILPLTIMGLLFIIGILGFVPFITAFVYLRNGVKAIRRGSSALSRSALIAAILSSAVLISALPVVAQWEVNHIVVQSVNEILGEDPLAAAGAVRRVKYLRWITDTDRIVRAYQEESANERRERLARAYKEITGEDIEMRLAILND
jgi:hypothetical protein